MDEQLEAAVGEYTALEGKSKEEILADVELMKLYIEFLEEKSGNLEQIADLTKQIAAQKDITIELLTESTDLQKENISLLETENKQLRTLLRKNGIAIPFN